MARLARVEAAGYPHHIIQRGNNRQAVFVDVADHQRYLTLLQEIASAQSVAVHAYVLMTNHVHLLVTPEVGSGVSRLMQGLGRRYVRWFNDRHARTGTLWEGRFRSTVIEVDRYFLACMRYIELNPVRAGISATPGEYRWSSNAHHVGKRIDPVITDHPVFWGLGNTPFERQSAYQQLIEEPLATEVLTELRQATNRGCALANLDYSHTIADSATSVPHSAARLRPRGRPRKRVDR
jgi:putative transposase